MYTDSLRIAIKEDLHAWVKFLEDVTSSSKLPGVHTDYGKDFRTIHHLVSNIEKMTAEELCKLALVSYR